MNNNNKKKGVCVYIYIYIKGDEMFTFDELKKNAIVLLYKIWIKMRMKLFLASCIKIKMQSHQCDY